MVTIVSLVVCASVVSTYLFLMLNPAFNIYVDINFQSFSSPMSFIVIGNEELKNQKSKIFDYNIHIYTVCQLEPNK